MSARLQLAGLASATYLLAVLAVGVLPAVAEHADGVLGSLTVLLGVVHGGTTLGLTYRRQGSTAPTATETPP